MKLILHSLTILRRDGLFLISQRPFTEYGMMDWYISALQSSIWETVQTFNFHGNQELLSAVCSFWRNGEAGVPQRSILGSLEFLV